MSQPPQGFLQLDWAFCFEILGPADREAVFLLLSRKLCGFHGEDRLVGLVLRLPTIEHAHWEIPVITVAEKALSYYLQMNFSAEGKWNKGATSYFSHGSCAKTQR